MTRAKKKNPSPRNLPLVAARQRLAGPMRHRRPARTLNGSHDDAGGGICTSNTPSRHHKRMSLSLGGWVSSRGAVSFGSAAVCPGGLTYDKLPREADAILIMPQAWTPSGTSRCAWATRRPSGPRARVRGWS